MIVAVKLAEVGIWQGIIKIRIKDASKNRASAHFA
jgi:hypothetical protein